MRTIIGRASSPWLSLVALLSTVLSSSCSKDDEASTDEMPSVERPDGGSASADDAGPVEWSCLTSEDEMPESLPELGCERDFMALAAQPSDSSLPGALSVKVIVDRVDENRLYFQNSNEFSLHYDFASTHLSATGDLPPIIDQRTFNENYTSDQRRFYLAAVTYYEGPDAWVLELAAYDTATTAMIEELYDIVSRHAYFGERLGYQ